jgi:phosphohistidine swiveling domain-containing protein
MATGSILIVVFTTPLHFELLLRCSGVVAEQGGLTSHAATLARELGKPCVVGVSSALVSIPAEREVVVDGDNGTVSW